VKTKTVKIRMPADLYLELVRRYGVRGLSEGVVELLREALGSEPESLEAASERVEVVKPPPEPPLPPAPKRTRWGFCPDCLAIYAFEGYDKCPKCGSKLVPMDSEENKKLYQELKRKKAAEGGGG
jgi:hypothetical protein